MLKFGEKVFVIIAEKVIGVTVRSHTSHSGVVTGYEVMVVPGELLKFKKGDIFTDEEDANKTLFLKILKANKEVRVHPSEDKRCDPRFHKGNDFRY